MSAWPESIRAPFRVETDESWEHGRRVVGTLADNAGLNDLLGELIGSGVVLHGCERLEPDLEEAFSRILERENETDEGDAS